MFKSPFLLFFQSWDTRYPLSRRTCKCFNASQRSRTNGLGMRQLSSPCGPCSMHTCSPGGLSIIPTTALSWLLQNDWSKKGMEPWYNRHDKIMEWDDWTTVFNQQGKYKIKKIQSGSTSRVQEIPTRVSDHVSGAINSAQNPKIGRWQLWKFHQLWKFPG